MTRYSVIFRNSEDEIREVDLWVADGTLDALQAAMMARFKPSTVIEDIRRIGVLMEVE